MNIYDRGIILKCLYLENSHMHESHNLPFLNVYIFIYSFVININYTYYIEKLFYV